MVKKTRKHILIVDDNHDILDLLEIFLYKEYDVMTALNGFEGIQKLNFETPDCVITDIMMPVMDGIKFYNTLRKREKCVKLPVIGITLFKKENTTRSLLNMGFFRVLAKPLSAENVQAAVRDAIGSGNGGKK